MNIDSECNIFISRGETFSSPVFINKGTREKPIRYNIGANDELYFGIMECNAKFEDAIVKKKYTKNDANENGDAVIYLTAEDTENLLPGLYYYSIKLRKKIGDNEYKVVTVVPNRKIQIGE